MPQSVLSSMAVDYSIPLKDMAAAILYTIKNKNVTGISVPPEVVLEARRSERIAVSVVGMDELGERSPYGCPDCGGTLWKMKDDGKGAPFPCPIGQAYTAGKLQPKQPYAA